MAPALCPGDYVLARVYGRFNRPPARGDIVVVYVPEYSEQSMLKRVIGLPYDRICFTDGTLLINGDRFVEKYLFGLPPYLGLENSDFTLGKDEYFVMGDNRAYSTDSRDYGPIHRSQIECKVVFRIWPLLWRSRL